MKAETIKNYVFNDDEKGWVIFNNKYWVVSRNLIHIKKYEDGIQVYSSPWVAYGRMYFKNNQLQVFEYDTNKEVAYCPIDDKFIPSIESQLPPIKQWAF